KALVGYDRVRRIRLSYRPVSMQSHRFQTEIWLDDRSKFQIFSTSWRGIVEQTRQDESYWTFIAELHRRIAANNAQVDFSIGTPVIIYWIGVVVFFVITFGFAAMLIAALRQREWAGAALVGGFLALFFWHLGNYFRRNRPGSYRPESLPQAVMPKR